MAMFIDAERIPRATVGKHCPVSQVDTVALLFAHGAYEQAFKYTFRG